jgi:hypothetical protein
MQTPPYEEVLEDDSDDYQEEQTEKETYINFRNSFSVSDKFKPKIINNKQQKEKKCNDKLIKNLAVNNYLDSRSEKRQDVRRSKDLTI